MNETFELGPASAGVRWTTAFVFFLILGLLVTNLALPLGPPWWLVALAISLPIVTWLYLRPKAIRIDGEFLSLDFVLRKLRFGIGDIQDCRRLSFSDLGPTVRVGIGGLFGNFGVFKSKHLGSVHGYFCNGESLVYVEVKKGRSLLLSVDRPDAFVAALLEAKSRLLPAASRLP